MNINSALSVLFSKNIHEFLIMDNRICKTGIVAMSYDYFTPYGYQMDVDITLDEVKFLHEAALVNGFVLSGMEQRHDTQSIHYVRPALHERWLREVYPKRFANALEVHF